MIASASSIPQVGDQISNFHDWRGTWRSVGPFPAPDVTWPPRRRQMSEPVPRLENRFFRFTMVDPWAIPGGSAGQCLPSRILAVTFIAVICT